MLEQPLDVAVAHWQRQNVDLRPPAAIEDIEQSLQHFATDDVRELYLRLDGFADHSYCKNDWCLWSLAEILDQNQFNPTHIIWFSDYLIWSYNFGFQPETPQTSSVHLIWNDDLTDTRKVADSVAEFLHLLVHDPNSIELFPISDSSSRAPNFLQRPPNFLQRLSSWWRGPA